MLDLVGNPKDKLSYDVAQLILYIPLIFIPQGAVVFCPLSGSILENKIWRQCETGSDVFMMADPDQLDLP